MFQAALHNKMTQASPSLAFSEVEAGCFGQIEGCPFQVNVMNFFAERGIQKIVRSFVEYNNLLFHLLPAFLLTPTKVFFFSKVVFGIDTGIYGEAEHWHTSLYTSLVNKIVAWQCALQSLARGSPGNIDVIWSETNCQLFHNIFKIFV